MTEGWGGQGEPYDPHGSLSAFELLLRSYGTFLDTGSSAVKVQQEAALSGLIRGGFLSPSQSQSILKIPSTAAVLRAPPPPEHWAAG